MNNPYSAPTAVLSEPGSADESYEPKIFSVSGRIGRLRYLAYSFFLMLIMMFLIGILAAFLMPTFAARNATGSRAAILMGILYIPAIIVTLIMVRRRLNDLDHSGWLSPIILVPLLNILFGLYLLFGSGSPGTNRYGPKPIKNSWLLVIGGLLFPVVIGIFAAISLSAYNDYT